MNKTETKGIFEINAISKTINMEQAQLVVDPTFGTHYLGKKVIGIGRSGKPIKNGIAALLLEILRENGARFEIGTENTEERKKMVNCCMSIQQVWEKVQKKFTAGGHRYPYYTVANYLSTNMGSGMNSLNSVGGTVAKFKLTIEEDSERGDCKCETVFYMIK